MLQEREIQLKAKYDKRNKELKFYFTSWNKAAPEDLTPIRTYDLMLYNENERWEEPQKIAIHTIYKNGLISALFELDPKKNLSVFSFGTFDLYHTKKTLPKQLSNSFIKDNKTLLFLWDQAIIFFKENPVYLYYFYDEDGNHFRLENLENGSISQANEMLKPLNDLSILREFFQNQRGGRTKGVRTKDTILKYNRIMNLRNSASYRHRTDQEFLARYPEYNQSTLNRAKKWYKEGRPGRK